MKVIFPETPGHDFNDMLKEENGKQKIEKLFSQNNISIEKNYFGKNELLFKTKNEEIKNKNSNWNLNLN